jgi:disulfide bond formation protein DsbB
MKLLGWILLIAGIIAIFTVSGWSMRIIAVVVALIGLWLTMKKQPQIQM